MSGASRADGPVGVGIVGFTPERSWAARAHVPALAAMPGYEVVGVANSSADSSRAAAAVLGLPSTFASVADLVADPAVDLVAVTVKVPQHRAVVQTALDAGRMVYCEWPLGVDLAEAQALADRARAAGVRTAVGLQARSAPTIRYLRDLVRDGYVGEVLSTTLVGSSGSMGAVEREHLVYLNDRSSGANVLTIAFGHAVDALCWVLGEFRDVSATLETRRATYVVEGTSEVRTRDIADQVLVTGVLTTGVTVAAHYRGGSSLGTNLRWEINGTEGDLEITGPSGHLQATDLTLRGGRGDEASLSVLPVPAEYRTVPSELNGPAVNVAESYARLAEGASAVDPVPDFDDAVRRHRLLDAIERSAATGQRIALDE